MERSTLNGDVRQRASKRSTKESVQTPRIRKRKSNDRSTLFALLALIGLVSVTALGAFMLYHQNIKQLTTTDSNKRDETPTSSPQKQQKTDGKLPSRRKKISHDQLEEGTQFSIGYHKTEENLVHIVDQVIRDRKNKIAVIRNLLVVDSPGIVATQARLLIPKTLPTVVNTSDWQLDFTYLNADYLRVLMAAGRALGVFNSSKKLVQALVIGLGGASISTYLRHATENVNVTAVEIDASMVEIAKKYFGFIEDERQHCVVDDGVNFIRECVRKGEKFDVVILDACKNVIELVEAPVKAFLESNAVQLMSQVIAKDGVLLINHLAIGVGPAPYVTVQKLFGEFFEGCMHFSVPATVNKAIVCVKRHSQYKYMQSQQFQSNMHKYFDELSSNA